MPYRCAVLGLSHDHVWWNLRDLPLSGEVEIVAAADPHEPLREQFSGRFAGTATYADPVACLDAVSPDLVLCCDSNAGNVPLVELAAARGIHSVVEKPMANDLAGADRMLRAAEAAGVHLVINWPTAWSPAFWHAARLARSGEYGPVWQILWRSAHNGPREVGCSEYFVDWLYDADRNGPAALMDYCCYGAVACRWLQGLPRRVTGLAGRLLKPYDIVNDNAVLLLDYDHGLSIVQASWTQVAHTPFVGGIICCEQAALQVRRDEVIVSTAADADGTAIAAEPVPEHRRSLGHYVGALLAGRCGPEGILDARLSRDAQAILEAGYRAAQTGQAQPVDA